MLGRMEFILSHNNYYMDSQDQGGSQSLNEQPQVEPAKAEQPQGSDNAETVEINGEQVPLEELKAGYMRQSDYTKKTQELSEKKKSLEAEATAFVRNDNSAQGAEELDPDVAAALDTLRGAGVVTKDDLKQWEKQQSDERKLQALIDANPDLASKEEALRAIGKTDTSAWEDIVVKYGFKESSKILKAKSRGVVGQPTSKEPAREKSVGQMSAQEYADWKAKNLKGTTF